VSGRASGGGRSVTMPAVRWTSTAAVVSNTTTTATPEGGAASQLRCKHGGALCGAYIAEGGGGPVQAAVQGEVRVGLVAVGRGTPQGVDCRAGWLGGRLPAQKLCCVCVFVCVYLHVLFSMWLCA
jgi:hypothetical protein